METLIQLYNSIGIYISAVLIIMIVILFIMVSVSLKSISKLERKYRKLTRGIENSNLEEVIRIYMDKIDITKNEIEEIKVQNSEIDKRVNKCIQKSSMIRYKAFEDIGSDLSFSFVLLDENNDGTIITSIYGRNESTIYAKPIDKGISRYDLSDEENEALSKAISK